MRIFALIAAWLALAIAPAHALTAAQKASVSVNPCAAPVVQLSFVSRAPTCFGGAKLVSPMATPGWTFSRASTGYAQTSAGLLVSFGSDVPRITDQGLLIEGAATNVALWSRDLTNAAWAKANATAALNLTGADGTANAASTLTATAANATAIQGATLASSVRLQSAFVKRISGSGVVNMTTDGGTTWTPVALTAAWTRVTIPAQTVTNPSFGFQITTSGDAVGVDLVQNETGSFATSPISTTSAASTRAADAALISPLITSNPVTLVVKASLPDHGSAGQFLAELSDYPTLSSGLALDHDSTSAAGALSYVSGAGAYIFSAFSAGATSLNIAASYDGANVAVSANGAIPTTTARPGSMAMSLLQVGSRAGGFFPADGYIKSVTVLKGATYNLQALSGGS